MKKKISAAVSAVIATACLLTACGKKETVKDDSSTPQDSSSASSAAESKAEESKAESTADSSESAPAAADTSADTFTEKELKLFSADENDPKTINVRFYGDLPNVPCIGLAQYKQLINGETLTVKKDGDTVVLTAPDGSSVTADPVKDTLTSQSWAEFRNDEEGMKAGKIVGFEDFGLPFSRIESIEYEPQKEPVVFDLAAYEIPVYADDSDVYMPLATINDLMIDGAFNRLVYDGENVSLPRNYFESAPALNTDHYKKMLSGESRSEDMIKYAYNELCFNFDKLYGCPGVACLDSVVAEKGLDAALSSTDELTASIKEELLLSSDPIEYQSGLMVLANYFFDQHTVLSDSLIYYQYSEDHLNKIGEIVQDYITKITQKSYYSSMLSIGNLAYDLNGTRMLVYGDEESYHSKGDTAVIVVNNFMDYDKEGWEAHYNDGADIPDGKLTLDVIGGVLTDLAKAKADPKIKNIVLDLSANGGGSNDMEATLTALILGKADLTCYDKASDRHFTIHYAIDSLFDGSFNTTGYFEGLDYNFAVLSSKTTFSCGNLFTSQAKDAGLPIFGEQSGGGSCMVRALMSPEGLSGVMSSCFGTLTNNAKEIIEAGVPVDEELVTVSEEGTKEYNGMYDLDTLAGLMKKYAKDKEPAAA